MKLHLPKTLFAAVLACFAAGASYGLGISSQASWSVCDIVTAVATAEEGTQVTKTWNGATYTYTVSDGMLVVAGYGLNDSSISVTFEANKANLVGLSNGTIVPLVHAQFATALWGINVKGTETGSVFTGQWNQNSNTPVNDWATAGTPSISNMAEDGIVTARFKKGSPGTTLANGETAGTTSAACIYFADGLTKSGDGALQSLKFSTTYVTNLIQQDVDSYQTDATSYTVTNADGSWTRNYSTMATAVSDTPVEATLVADGRLEIDGGTDATQLSTNGGDIIIGGSGQLFLQTWGYASAPIVLDNAIYLGSSTHNDAESLGALRIGSDSATTTINGNITLVEDSSIGANNGGRDVYINGKVSGDHKLSIVKGTGIDFKGGMDLGALELGSGVSVDIIDQAATVDTFSSTGAGASVTVSGTTLTISGLYAGYSNVLTTGEGGSIVFGPDATIDVANLTAEGSNDYTVDGFIQESYRVTASGVNASISGGTIVLLDHGATLGNATWNNGVVAMGEAVYNVAGTKSYDDYLAAKTVESVETVAGIMVQDSGTFTTNNKGQTVAILGTGTLSAAWSGRAQAGDAISLAAKSFSGDVVVQSGASWLIGDGYSFSSVTVGSGGQFGLDGTYTGDITISGSGTSAGADQQGALKFGDGGTLIGNVTISGAKAALSTWNTHVGTIRGDINSATEDGAELEILNGSGSTNNNTITVTGNLSGINKVTTTAASMTVDGTISNFGETFTKSGAGTLTVGSSISGTLEVEGGTLSVGGLADGTTTVNIEEGANFVFAANSIVEVDSAKGFRTSGEGTLQATTLRSTGGSIELNSNATISGGSDGQDDLNRKSGLALTGGSNEISIQGGTVTVSGATYLGCNGGTLSVGSDSGTGSATLVTTRLELGDSSSGNSTLKIGSTGVIVITSAHDTFGSTGTYQTTGLILSEWGNTTTANVRGTLLARDVKLYSGDTKFNLNIENGGTVAVKGIAQSITSKATENVITLEAGGKLVLGSGGIVSAGNGTWAINFNGGEVGMSADTMVIDKSIALGGTVTFNTTQYVFQGDGAGQSLMEGAEGGAMTLSGVVSGTGSIKKTGEGTLILSGANTYNGGTEMTAGTLAANSAGGLGTEGTIAVSGGTLQIGAAVDLGDRLTQTGGTITVAGDGSLTLGTAAISSAIQNEGTLTFTGSITSTGLAATSSDLRPDEGTNNFLRHQESLTVVTGTGSVVANDVQVTQGGKTYTLKADGTASLITYDYSTYCLTTGDGRVAEYASWASQHGDTLTTVEMTSSGTLTVDADLTTLNANTQDGTVNITTGTVQNLVVNADTTVMGLSDPTVVEIAGGATSTLTGGMSTSGISFSGDGGASIENTGEGSLSYGLDAADAKVKADSLTATGSDNVSVANQLEVKNIVNNGTGILSVTGTVDSTEPLESIAANNGDIAISNGVAVQNLTVNGNKELSVQAAEGAASTITVTREADIAGTVSADVTVQSNNGDAPATFTANSGAEVGGNLTVTDTGKLVLASVAGADGDTADVLSVGSTLTATSTAISLSTSVASVINNAIAGLDADNASASFTLAKATGFTISGWTIDGQTVLTDAQLASLGLTPTGNVSFTLNTASTMALSRSATPSELVLTATYVAAADDPAIGGVALDNGMKFENGVLSIAVKMAQGVTADDGNFDVTVGGKAWDAIVDAMNGETYQNAYVTLVDASGNELADLRSVAGVTLNGYTGTGTPGEYFVAYIPEPATATLSLLALVALAARRRRK